VAERSGVRHESPQVICFAGKKAVRHASHYGITAATLKDMFTSK
jgi:bacillithiol system protein YtxJ